MKTVIFCEGTTDILLLQFVLQYKYDWNYKGFVENTISNRLIKRELIKDSDSIELYSCGGITNIPNELLKVKDILEYSTKKEELYDRVIVMIDHDTVSSSQEFIEQVNEKLESQFYVTQINQFIEWNVDNMIFGKISTKLFIKCIPENDTGAIESILLAALETDDTEKELVAECADFIGEVSSNQHRYLQKKSRINKAVFNTYFAIRAPEEKYDERAKILRAYDWKNNKILENSFNFLEV